MAENQERKVIYNNVSRIGKSIIIRGRDENQKRVEYVDEFHPTLFIETDQVSKYKTIHDKYVKPIKPGTMYDCAEFIKKYEDVHGFNIHGNTNYVLQWISDYYENIDLSSVDVQNNVKIAYFDIECQSENGFPDPHVANEQINAITIHCAGKTYILGVGKFHIDRPNHQYECFHTEREMLETFMLLWNELDFDVITGWNSDMFDIPYVINRIAKIFGDKEPLRLSPCGKIIERKTNYFNKQHIVYQIVGLSVLDYQRLYQKYRLVPRESYKLDHIAEVELGSKKLDWKDKYDSMKEFYTKDFQLFIEYNIRDVDIVKQLEDKLKLLELHISIAYMAKVNYEDVFSQVRTWDSIIYNHLRAKNVVIPPSEHKIKSYSFEGAFVKDPEIGVHEWIMSFDLNSLYPMILSQYNIGPDTMVTEIKLQRIINES